MRRPVTKYQQAYRQSMGASGVPQNSEVVFVVSNALSLAIGVSLLWLAITRAPDDALLVGAGCGGALLVVIVLIDVVADVISRAVAFRDERQRPRGKAAPNEKGQPASPAENYVLVREGNQPARLLSKVETEREKEYNALRQLVVDYLIQTADWHRNKATPEDPNTATRLAGNRDINWSQQQVKRATDALAPYVRKEAGKGIFITSTQYPTLAHLYAAVAESKLPLASLNDPKQTIALYNQ